MNILYKQNGFTLVELAVVLGIVSILAVGSVTMFSEQKENVEKDMREDKLSAVKVALLRFAEKNHYLPCPDTNNIGNAGFGLGNRIATSVTFDKVWATFGKPARPATATAPFIPAVPAIPEQPARTVNVDVCAQTQGSVPFDMLNLSLADVQDTEGQMFHYAVTQGVTNAGNIANCPVDSACFFNRNTVPAFSNETEPVAGSLGLNNLMVCANPACLGVDLLANGLVAVVLALNKNAAVGLMGLSANEIENRDNDTVFIQSPYVREGNDFFDDLLVTISGHELKSGEQQEFQTSQIAGSFGTTTYQGNELLSMGDNTLGGSGTNIGTDKVKWDKNSQNFDFGAAVANKEIVLKYKTHAVGTWDQPSSPSSSVTSDTATVTSNGALVEEYKYDFTDDTQDGVQAVSFKAGFTGWLETRDSAGNQEYIYITKGQTYNTYADYWDEEVEVVLETDNYGNIDLEFAVGTTATYETIDFTDIELIYYNTPPPIPQFPQVVPILGIEQTKGLL